LFRIAAAVLGVVGVVSFVVYVGVGGSDDGSEVDVVVRQHVMELTSGRMDSHALTPISINTPGGHLWLFDKSISPMMIPRSY
jgi:hypothetical protein